MFYIGYESFNGLSGNIGFRGRRKIFTALYFAKTASVLLPFSCHSEGMRRMSVQFQTTSSKRYHYDWEGSVSFMTPSDLCLFLVQIIKGSSEKIDQRVTVHKAQNLSKKRTNWMFLWVFRLPRLWKALNNKWAMVSCCTASERLEASWHWHGTIRYTVCLLLGQC